MSSLSRTNNNPSVQNGQDQKPAEIRRGHGPGLRSIAPLLRHLAGLYLKVELKNGRVFYGILRSCDDFMSVVLQNAQQMRNQEWASTFKRPKLEESGASSSFSTPNNSKKLQKTNLDTIGAPNWQSKNNINENSDHGENLSPHDYDLLHIRGPTIRYIHLPQDVNIPGLIREGIDRERAAMDKYKRGKRK